ncbi:MAG: hypothetical protein Fur0016_19640 [Anaerolineales bacterium]
MKSPARIGLFCLMTAALLLTACSAQAAATPPAPAIEELAPPAAPQGEPYRLDSSAPPAQKSAEAESQFPAQGDDMPGAGVVVQTGADALTAAQSDNRMVIKNGEIRLSVEDADNAIDRALQVVGDVRGYIISSRSWYQTGPDGKNYKYATVTIGVPADQFETAMRRFRAMALRVLDENASGQDVSDEYVDLQSQLVNLEATRDRIRSFLNEAKTVEESLRVNKELSNIEGEIEKVKGRMNYLSSRAAFSTISVTFEPEIPPLPPTPTRTPIPTATPKPWNPGETAQAATKSLTSIYQALIELAIWVFIVIVPLLAPPLLVAWGIFKLATRKKTQAAK